MLHTKLHFESNPIKTIVVESEDRLGVELDPDSLVTLKVRNNPCK